MKKLLLGLSLFIALAGYGQKVYPTKIAGLNALVYTYAGMDTALPANLLFWTPGAGEQGLDITKLYINGPFRFLKTGYDIKAPLLIVAVQNVNPNPRPEEIQSYIDGIKKLYKINKIVLTGLSRGGQNAEWYANVSEANLSTISGIVVFSSQGSPVGVLPPSLYLKYNIPVWRGEGDQDFTWDINNNANKAFSAAAPKLAFWSLWPGAGHGDPVWAQGYDPFPVATNPIYATMKMSIYQWASTIMGAPPAPPVVVIITYKSIAQTATYSKACTCGTPSLVTYTVPAGKYTSTVSQAQADSLATADMLTNGQAYANTNGVCTPVLVTTVTTVTQVYSDGTTKSTTTQQP